MESKEVAMQAVGESAVLTASDVRAQVNLIQEVMASVMKDGSHYGTIPGCGDKKALFKPGAEKLMMTFKLAVEPIIEEVPTDDGLTFRVTCRITSQQTGVYLGSGVGECSTKEEKYHWRKAVCDEEFDATPENKRRVKWSKGYKNKPAYSTKQVQTNPADLANTVLKMAKKRALVDATLTVTAASDIFTQDIEDMDEVEDPVKKVKYTDTVETKGKPEKKKAAKGKADSTPAQGMTVQDTLEIELANYCGGDADKMYEVCKNLTLFTDKDGNERFVDYTTISTISDKWAGTALRKLRELPPLEG